MEILDIPIIRRSEDVLCITSHPPKQRLRPAYSSNPRNNVAAFISSMRTYEGRPAGLADVTCTQYFRTYDVTKKKHKRGVDVADPNQHKDAFGRYVYKLRGEHTKLVRFSDPSPLSDPEGFFYNILLHRKPFLLESDLISTDNTSRTYAFQCYLDDYVTTVDDLQGNMEAWSDRNLLGPERHCALVQQVMTSRFADFVGSPEEDDPFDRADDSAVARALQRLGPMDATTLATKFGEDLATLRLNPEQQAIFDSITSLPRGKAAVSGVPGAGKTLLARKLALHFEAACKVLGIAALTGAASTRLSSSARTLHSSFRLPARGELIPP
eukprot:360032-Chlamydomonas_euryale.AAC.3